MQSDEEMTDWRRRLVERVRAYWTPVRVEAFLTLVACSLIALVYVFGIVCAAMMNDHLGTIHFHRAASWTVSQWTSQ
jgi:hypothetical protein